MTLTYIICYIYLYNKEIIIKYIMIYTCKNDYILTPYLIFTALKIALLSSHGLI